jgi:hypothetical protein
VRSDEMGRHVGRYYGKYRGKVADNADEKFRGTLMVVVPSVFGPDTPVPATPCLPYGHFFVPPVGTDVWVEFEAGDIASPLWVGVWYPDGTAPVEARVSPPEHRVIQTAAGHTIEIVDTEGEEQILIRHATDAFVRIDHNGSVLLANPKGSHLHLDAENEKATLVEAHGNHLAMGEQGTAVVNPQGTVVNVVDDTVHISAAKVILNATSVALGNGAAEPTIMANAFNALWDAVLNHTHPIAGITVTGTCPAGTVAGTATGTSSSAPALASMKLVPGTHLTSAVVVK